MNILLYSHTFFPKVGGREIVVQQLARAYSKLGHSVAISGPGWKLRSQKMRTDVPVHRYPWIFRHNSAGVVRQTLFDFQMALYLIIELKRRPYDMIHLHSLYPCGYALSLAKRFLPKVPVIATPHGIDINTVPQENYGMRLDPVLRSKIDKALSNASVVTAISDGVYESIIATGVPVESVQRINNGIDLERFTKAEFNLAKETFGLDESSKILLGVGNYTPLKGFENMVRAMPEILKTFPETKLILVGEGMEVLYEDIEHLELVNNVLLTGPILPPSPNTTKPDLLASLYTLADIYISASTAVGAEGLSLAILDALAAGLPIVSTDIAGNREIVHNLHNGLLVPVQDAEAIATAVRSLFSHPDLRETMSLNSLDIAAKMDWTKVAEEYIRAAEKAQDSLRSDVR